MQKCDWFVPGGLCFELAKGMPAAFVALVIGAIAAYIAWGQWRVAKAKLNFDLFEKRYKIFEAVWVELSRAVQLRKVEIERPEFTNLMPQAQFLFGLAIREYMSEILTKTAELWAIQKSAEANNNIVPPERIERHWQLMEWLADHAINECRAHFGPYLDFSNWS